MSFNFVVDRVVKDQVYPALAQWSAEPYTPEWRQFIHHWPYTIPCDLIEHCATQNFPFTITTDKKNFAPNSFYPIGIGFFDFSIDYFSLLPTELLDPLRSHLVQILFYYDEGDNPFYIKDRLDQLCNHNSLPKNCYKFISANSAADQIPGFVYCLTDELRYWKQNKSTPPVPILDNKREKDFTVLCRTHKLWRATAMTDLMRQGLLDNSYVSYNKDLALDEDPKKDNPLELVSEILKPDLAKFLANAPYTCDNLTSDQHNDHSVIEPSHYTNSYCSIVIETHFDVESSRGSFLTEKTFKAIKHGHPFVIIGAPGSIDILNRFGYDTFDDIIDHSYDLEFDNVKRWIMIVETIRNLKNQNMHDWFTKNIGRFRQNQLNFVHRKTHRLNKIYDKLLHQLATT